MARGKFDAASISELMGTNPNAVSKKPLGYSDLPDLLGEKMPDLESKNPLTRFRLLSALKQRFGPGFRNIPNIKGLIDEFDKDMETEIQIQRIKRSKESRNG